MAYKESIKKSRLIASPDLDSSRDASVLPTVQVAYSHTATLPAPICHTVTLPIAILVVSLYKHAILMHYLQPYCRQSMYQYGSRRTSMAVGKAGTSMAVGKARTSMAVGKARTSMALLYR